MKTRSILALVVEKDRLFLDGDEGKVHGAHYWKRRVVHCENVSVRQWNPCFQKTPDSRARIQTLMEQCLGDCSFDTSYLVTLESNLGEELRVVSAVGCR